MRSDRRAPRPPNSKAAQLLLLAMCCAMPSAAQSLAIVWVWKLYGSGPAGTALSLCSTPFNNPNVQPELFRPVVLPDGSVAAFCPQLDASSIAAATHAAKISASGTPLRSSAGLLYRQNYAGIITGGRVTSLVGQPVNMKLLRPDDLAGQYEALAHLMSLDTDGMTLLFQLKSSSYLAGYPTTSAVYRTDAAFGLVSTVVTSLSSEQHPCPPAAVSGGYVICTKPPGQSAYAVVMVSSAGSTVWSTAIPTIPWGTGITLDASRTHLLLLADTTLFVIKLADGNVEWSLAGTAAATSTSTPIAPDGKVALLWGDGLQLVDPATQVVVWTYSFTPAAGQQPVIDAATGLVYVVSSTGSLIAVRLATGTVAWTQAVTDTVAGTPALLPGGQLVLCTTSSAADSTARVYATANGQAGSTLPVPGRCGAGPVVAPDGQAYLQTSTHIVAVSLPSPCPLGQARQGAGAGGACAPCPAGSQATAGGRACVLCPIGTYSSSAGSTSCELCPNYLYSAVPGATSCQECPVNWEAEAAYHNRYGIIGDIEYPGPDHAKGSRRCYECPARAQAVRAKGEPHCHWCSSGTEYDGGTRTCKPTPQLIVSATLCALYGAFTLVSVINIVRGTGWGIFKAKGGTARAVLSFIVMQTVDQVSDTVYLASLSASPVRFYRDRNDNTWDNEVHDFAPRTWFNTAFAFIVLPPLAQLVLTGYPALLAFARRKVLLFKEHKSPEAFFIDGAVFLVFAVLATPLMLIFSCMHASNFFVWRPFVHAMDRIFYGHTRDGDLAMYGPLRLLDTRELTRTALVGAMTESLPQLIVQILIAQDTKQAGWQLYFSAALSSYMIFRSLFQAVYSMALLKIPFHSLDFYFDAEKAVKDGLVAPLGKAAAGAEVSAVSSSEVTPMPMAHGLGSASTMLTGQPPGSPNGASTVLSPSYAPDPATPLPPLPAGWLEVKDPSGPTFYSFLATGRSQYERPGVVQPALPKGWVAIKDPVGRAFYVDTRTGAAQFARPAPTPAPASASSSTTAGSTAKAEAPGSGSGDAGSGVAQADGQGQEGSGPRPQGTMLALRALSATAV